MTDNDNQLFIFRHEECGSCCAADEEEKQNPCMKHDSITTNLSISTHNRINSNASDSAPVLDEADEGSLFDFQNHFRSLKREAHNPRSLPSTFSVRAPDYQGLLTLPMLPTWTRTLLNPPWSF